MSRAEYAGLFAAIGTTYGAGDGVSTFNLPDLRARVPGGVGGAWSLGDQLGAYEHTLTVDEMPAHRHSYVRVYGATGDRAIPAGGGANYGFPAQTGYTGGGQPHNNIQPTLVVHYIIYAGV